MKNKETMIFLSAARLEEQAAARITAERPVAFGRYSPRSRGKPIVAFQSNCRALAAERHLRRITQPCRERTSVTMSSSYKNSQSPPGGDRSLNAVWTYETPFKAMEQIKDYVAFHPDRVDAIGSHGAKALIPPDKEAGK